MLKIPKPHQEPPAFSKALIRTQRTLKVNVNILNLKYCCIKDHQTNPNCVPDPQHQSGKFSILKSQNQHFNDTKVLCTNKIYASKTSNYIFIKIQIQNPSQEPASSSKALIRTERT